MRNPTDRPNIILINCDDLGYGDLSCYGSSVNRTPVLDSMAAAGVRFTDFYMASPVCSPSRGAMMTGCYPRRIGFGTFDGAWVLFPGQGVGLNPSEITMATLLRRQGYATYHIGKWHCGDQKEFLPTRHGFNSYFGIPYSNDMGWQVGWDNKWPPLPLMRDEEVIQAQPDQPNLIERYTERAVGFIRDNREKPFFLYLAHMQVHLPLYAPQRFVDASQNGRYGACVEAVDWSTAVLLYELRRLGLENNTLVIFTSDNGSRGKDGGSNAPLAGHKGTTYDGGLRVPCIMRWPGVIPAGRTCSEMALSMDFLPTFAGLAGTKAPDDRIVDGADIRPLMLGETGARSPHEAFFYHHVDTLFAVRSGRYKLHVRRQDKEVRELFDMEKDVGETVNLYDSKPDVVRELMKHIDHCREDIGDAACKVEGANRRPCGRVSNPVPLTVHDADYPYMQAEYDLHDRG
ncbi:MAG: sulfatase [Phycisphaerae bacterium]